MKIYDGGVAITGTGFMGPAHLEALRRLGIHVVGILGSSPQKSRSAAEAMGLEKAYESFDAILADDDVQVVHLTTPNRIHFATARDALLSRQTCALRETAGHECRRIGCARGAGGAERPGGRR